MFPSFIITFREALEAALIVGIILSYLVKTKQTKYNNVVYMGVAAGIVASVIIAIGFTTLAGGFEGTSEALFEGATMFIGAALLTSMILWMMKQKHIAVDLHKKVAFHLEKSQRYGLFFLVFFAILREGVETVIFLKAASMVSFGNSLVGAVLGLVFAVVLGYMIFVSTRKVNLKRFFTVTSVLLILFAGGLVAHGVHEFQEAGVIPFIVYPIWDMNPTPLVDGVYPLLHEKGTIGSILKGLFGYNGNPSLIEVIAYLTYLVAVALMWWRIDHMKWKEMERNGK